MNIFRSGCIMFLFLLTGPLTAQEIITIIEKDRDGKYLDRNNAIKADYINNKIADINSVLEIKLDQAKLAVAMGKLSDEGLPGELSLKISAILAALEKRNEVLTELTRIVKSYNAEQFLADPAAYNSYIADLSNVTQVLYEVERIDPRIENEALQYDDPDEMYTGVYKAAEKVLAGLVGEFEQYANDQGVLVQFGCWLITKNQNTPVHLQGFDDIAPLEPYEVERWQFVPTAQQLSDLEDIQRLAKENKDMGLNILKVTAQNQLKALKDFGNIKLQQLVLNLENEAAQIAEGLGQAIDPELKLLIADISALKLSISEFAINLDRRLDYYKSISYIDEYEVINFIYHARNDIRFIIAEDGLKLKNDIDSIGKQLSGLKPAISNTAANLKNLFIGLSDKYIAGFKSFEAFTKKKVEEFIAGREFDIAALEFGNDVYKLTLSDLPSSTELDLINTGVRTDGDRLAFKLTVTVRDKPQAVVSESRELYMFKVLPHIITTVGVIFADPLANTAVQTQFQMAPCFNVLFKGLGDQGRRRKSVIYNRLFDYGIGLHISAPDFNKDDVPEMTAGIVVSCLHDYLQSGFAFNLFTGDPFWFFGLRLPVPSFNLNSSVPGGVE